MAGNMSAMAHRTTAELEAALDDIRSAPTDGGTLELIVARPAEDRRVVLEEGILDVEQGLVGDNWSTRPNSQTSDGGPHPRMQLNLMMSRVIGHITDGDRERWPLAGDQLFVDLDLSSESLPPGTRLAMGEAVIEITEVPHRGCAKFTRRFGLDAHHFVNSPLGSELSLRGVNAIVVEGGAIRPGDRLTRV